jgi:hypothetical protein
MIRAKAENKPNDIVVYSHSAIIGIQLLDRRYHKAGMEMLIAKKYSWWNIVQILFYKIL